MRRTPSNRPERQADLRAQGWDVDPLGDGDALDERQARKNYAKVGTARPSSLLYTNGPGSIIDLPHFTVMPTGLDDWDRIWERRRHVPKIQAPRLLDTVRVWLGRQVSELRPFPHQETASPYSREGNDLGIPARIFPQWLRCTGCDLLAPLRELVEGYSNTHRFRSDEAVVRHEGCSGRRTAHAAATGARKPRRGRSAPLCVPARYLLVCPDGHVDEFPYDWWVHEGGRCPKAERPRLAMTDASVGRGASAVVHCRSCGARRGMNEAQGEVGRAKLPQCRGRFPHLGGFTPDGCTAEVRLMLVGASNLWFPVLQSIVDMPRLDLEAQRRSDAELLRGVDDLTAYRNALPFLRKFIRADVDLPNRLADLSDEDLAVALDRALAPAAVEQQSAQRRWDPIDLLVPEWHYLQQEPPEPRHEDPESGLIVSPRPLGGTSMDGLTRVLAVDRLRRVNAILGFTRVDEVERVADAGARLVPLCRNRMPQWVPATVDRGEGVFLELDEERVHQWEEKVADSALWKAHVEAHRRNYDNRLSETAAADNHLTRMAPPRYWLVHTFAHALLRQMAMSSGYAAASLSERIYAWPRREAEDDMEQRDPAAGLLIMTTASDSDGTLGGLVSLSEPHRLREIVRAALAGMMRCSSDPVCSQRVPRDPEDFLHGAACHCCTMVSETSCERANRFLDRRFVVSLPGEYGEHRGEPFADLAFFEDPRG